LDASVGILVRVSEIDLFPELTQYLAATTPMGPAEVRRVVADVLSYFSEPADAFVRRRHRELQADGLANAEIFTKVAEELAGRRVVAATLSARQLRRLVYG
jgi:hypothetical protein